MVQTPERTPLRAGAIVGSGAATVCFGVAASSGAGSTCFRVTVVFDAAVVFGAVAFRVVLTGRLRGAVVCFVVIIACRKAFAASAGGAPASKATPKTPAKSFRASN